MIVQGGGVGIIKVRAEAIKYDKVCPIGRWFAFSWVEYLEEVVVNNIKLGNREIFVEIPD